MSGEAKQEQLSKRLRFGEAVLAFWARFGRRLILPLTFLTALSLHVVLTLFMETPMFDSGGFSSVAWGGKFSGNDFTGVLSLQDSYNWLTGILYAPVMLVFANPFHQYTAMLIVNGCLAALLPVFAFKIAVRAGLKRSRQRICAALVAGLYPAVILHTKFVGNGTLNLLFPCMIALIMLNISDMKKAVPRHFLTMLLSFVTAISLFTDVRMFAVALSLIVTVTLARIFTKTGAKHTQDSRGNNAGNFPVITLLVYLFVFVLVLARLSNNIGAGLTGFALFEIRFTAGISEINTVELLQKVFSHLYYFTVETCGIGIVGICLFVKHIRDFRRGGNLQLFSMFAFLSLMFGLFLSITGFARESIEPTREFGMLFGEYTDNIIPLILLAAIISVCIYQPDLRLLLYSTLVTGGIFTVFFALNTSETAGIQPVNAEATISIIFCIIALLVVLVCCGGQYKTRIVAAALAMISLCSCIHACWVYLPQERDKAFAHNSPVYELSELIYNSEDAPPVIVNGLMESEVRLLQFLNQKADVSLLNAETEFPESYLLIMPSFSSFMPYNEHSALLGVANEYIFVYAMGEKALMYAASQK